mmetsp:Transcript_63070/g.140505  ORF Transcript_63070/g.140505 Transcript_63070/m.140505 type:complete len:214 (+) Transcript_63070:832-1473(+)
MSGVFPLSFRSSTGSGLYISSNNSLSTSVWPYCAAVCSAANPLRLSVTSARLSRSNRTASVRPYCAARRSGVRPSSQCAMLIASSGTFPRRNSRIWTYPSSAAILTAQDFDADCWPMLSPDSTISFTFSRSPSRTASMSGVTPLWASTSESDTEGLTARRVSTSRLLTATSNALSRKLLNACASMPLLMSRRQTSALPSRAASISAVVALRSQ